VSADPQAPAGLVNWRDLPPRQRWQWWDERWHEAIALSERYRLALRSGWWEDSVRVEALAAFAAWVATYDTEVSIDPPGKLQLLAQLDWLRTALHGGERAFHPPADRRAFDRHLFAIGCRAPDGRELVDPDADRQLERHRCELQAELAAIETRLLELDDRERTLHAELDRAPINRRADHAQRDLSELKRTIAQLRQRRRDLRRQLDEAHKAA
jgi:hypothetical protein